MADDLDDELGNFTHNSGDPDVLTSAAQGRLLSFVERLERLSEDAAAIREDVKEVKAEAKGEGYCPKTLAKVVKIRAMDRAKRLEQEAILDLYLAACGLD